MKSEVCLEVDVLVVGAGPVGLMCAYLGKLCGLNILAVDKSEKPLEVGRADALNGRTLQLLELINLLDDLYPLGKPCNTSSVWENGKFLSRQSAWWDELEGCFHKHFLMLGQSKVEKLLDSKLAGLNSSVLRSTSIESIEVDDIHCCTSLSNGTKVKSKYVIGADGSRSFVRNLFHVPFEIERPKIVWAVIDGIIDTDFSKVPEIIVFQAETSDVAWIPREGEIDRFYVRMDTTAFTIEDATQKINRATSPHKLRFTEIEWFSKFSVKESVAENFQIKDRIFLAGDSCHIHSVNGGQGLNTGLADAFNLMWKLNMRLNFDASDNILETYESERKPVAKSVIESSGELVRSTKYSETGTHAQDYVRIVAKRAGNITGMGIDYGNKGGYLKLAKNLKLDINGDQPLKGSRLFDLELEKGENRTRLYSLLDYTKFTLVIFGSKVTTPILPKFINIIKVEPLKSNLSYSAINSPYNNQAILVRPDSYIELVIPIENIETHLKDCGLV